MKDVDLANFATIRKFADEVKNGSFFIILRLFL